jgi:folate-dependent phosphoribosylglycinamide formyltransferase PurN
VKKILLITGNEISHTFFVNSLKNKLENKFKVDVIRFFSGKSDYEFYYGVYGGNSSPELHNNVLDFIFKRNIEFARNESYNDLTVREGNDYLFSDKDNFCLKLEELTDKENKYFAIFAYGAPIIKNVSILSSNNIFNLHMGLSKHYRGGSANIFALSKKEFDKVGATCHTMEKDIDDGDVIFEIENFSFQKIDNLDKLRYVLLKMSIDKISSILLEETFVKYSITKGKLILNKDVLFSNVIEAENNLRKGEE